MRQCQAQRERLNHGLSDAQNVCALTKVGTVLKAPAKRSQHANATHRNIVGRNMLRVFGYHVAMCYDVLGVVGLSLKMAKYEPTTPNMSQHITTRWPNARNMLPPIMLGYVALACCDRFCCIIFCEFSKIKWLLLMLSR